LNKKRKFKRQKGGETGRGGQKKKLEVMFDSLRQYEINTFDLDLSQNRGKNKILSFSTKRKRTYNRSVELAFGGEVKYQTGKKWFK